MTGHDLEVGAVIDLDIGGGGSTRRLESDRSTWADVVEELTLVPRRLPLGSHR